MNESILPLENKEISSLYCQEKMMSRKEAAKFLEVKENTLAIWANTKRYNLPMYKVGKYIKYKISDLQKFKEGELVSDNVDNDSTVKLKKIRKIRNSHAPKKKKQDQISCFKWLYSLFCQS